MIGAKRIGEFTVSVPGHDPILFPARDVPEGEILLLRGSNGSGKTTLLRHLASPAGARAFAFQTRKRALMIDQDFDALIYPQFPVWWNAGLGLLAAGGGSKDVRRAVKGMFDRFGVDVDLDCYPSYKRLSGGERHLTVCVRALLSDADVLLLDEPFTQIDVEKAAVLERAIYDAAARGRLVVVVSHEGAPRIVSVSQDCEIAGFDGEPIRAVSLGP